MLCNLGAKLVIKLNSESKILSIFIMKLETLVIFALTLKRHKVNIHLFLLFNARMAELVDAHDSNSCSLECGFDSHRFYQLYVIMPPWWNW